MNLFIDTNVFLSFYHLTSDDLEELRKLSVLLEKGEVTLFLPDQVVDEFRRNRENKIADAIKKLKSQSLNLQFPQLCKDYDEYPKLRELQKQYEKEHSKIIKNIIDDVEGNSLKADEIIEDLFNKASLIETTDDLISNADLRMAIGNPPGKNGSLGDAIDWEALLDNVPDNEDLYLIADDRDYFSCLDENKPKEFLAREWNEKKGSNVILYRRLSPFFNEHYPDIKLASELEKEILIRELVASPTFATTHSVVARLSKYEDFSIAQVNQIVEASLANNQISWIIGDSEIFVFLSNLVESHKDKIEESNLQPLIKILEENAPDE